MAPIKAALLGRNIAYSRSPDIFAAMGKCSGADIAFELYDIGPEQLAETLGAAVERGFAGLAVTVPYKRAVIHYLDEVTQSAARVGAVNSIHLPDGRLIGYNTDVAGFTEAVKQVLPVDASGRPVVVVGAGGAARAVCVALDALLKPSNLLIAARESHAICGFVDWLGTSMPAIQTSVIQERTLQLESVPDGSIVVNCTPLGGFGLAEQSPFAPEFAWKSVALYCDLNYNPHNPLVKTARQKGIAAMDGSSMLVRQALESFQIWTGVKLSFDAVYPEVFHTE